MVRSKQLLIIAQSFLLECHSEMANRMREDHKQEHVIAEIEKSVLADRVKYRVLIQVTDDLEKTEGLSKTVAFIR